MAGINQKQREKQLSFIQRLYPFGNQQQNSNEKQESPKSKKFKKSEDSSDEHYSVQKLKQFWNNRIVTSQAETLLVVKQKSATLGATNKSSSETFLRRNSLRSSNSRKSIVRNKLIPLYSEKNNAKSENSLCENSKCNENKSDSVKRTSLDLIPSVKESDLVQQIKKTRPNSANFPIAVSQEGGGKIHWANRTETFGIIRANPNENKTMAPATKPSLDIEIRRPSGASFELQKLEHRDSVGSKNSTSSSKSSTTGKHGQTPGRKVSFRTQSGISTYNRKLLSGNGSKVATLTKQFNKFVQQDPALLEEVKNRGGYVHKTGNHVYKIKEDTSDLNGIKKKNNRKDDSSADEISIPSGKNSYRKPSLKRRPSIRKYMDDSNRVIKVQDALKLFDPNNQEKRPIKIKPKVPDKSEQVIQKTKEIKNKKLLLCDKNNISKISEILLLKTVPNNKKPTDMFGDVSETVENIAETKNSVLVSEKENNENSSKISDELNENSTRNVKNNWNVGKLYDRIMFRSTKKSEKEPEKASSPKQKEIEPEKASSPKQKEIEPEKASSPKQKEIKPKNSSSHTVKEAELGEARSLILEEIELQENSSLINRKDAETIEAPLDDELNPHHSPVPVEKETDKEIPIEETESSNEEINSVYQKIDNLSKSFSEVNLPSASSAEAKKLQPNSSFLFRSTSRTSTESGSNTNLVEAFNNIVINKSVSMDDFNSFSPASITAETAIINSVIQMIDEPIVPIPMPIPMEVDVEDDYELVEQKELSFSDEIFAITNKIESFVYKSKEHECENIYQSLTQVQSRSVNEEDNMSINSYESFENYEHIQNCGKKKPSVKDIAEGEYEICDPPEPPPPRKPESCPANNDNSQLPIREASPDVCDAKLDHYQSKYERIKYDKIPPKPPLINGETDRNGIPLPPRNANFEKPLSSESLDTDYEENIYDTIKQADTNSCYESFLKLKNNTDISLISSNCYESIISSKFDFHRSMIRHAESITTLNSEHNTNSIYGTAIGTQSLSPPSERSNSDSSSDWVDISDDEEKQKLSFVVYRERKNCHRTPLWSRKVRGHRMQQQQKSDDSDHHYESLSSIGIDKSRIPGTTFQPSKTSTLQQKKSSESSTYQGTYLTEDHSTIHDDEFDSFESENETDDELNRKTDSGVDISNAKLPDPPVPNGQVYAFMQKIKNIGTLSKSEITKGFIKIAKKRNSSSKSLKSLEETGNPEQPDQKIYEANTMTISSARNKLKNLKLPIKISKNNLSSDPYENTEFHKPITPTTPKADSSPKIELKQEIEGKQPEVPLRKKSKTGKSFKSKLRKSLYSDSSLNNIGSSFNGTRSTFYLDSGDVDSGIYNGSDHQNSNSNSNANLSSNSDRDSNTIVGLLKTPENTRRKSVSPTNRPTNPPPPPPVDKLGLPRHDKSGNSTTWYHTWGLFKPDDNENKTDRTLCSTSWYADAGLYVTSADSVASSSESSGVSTGAGDDHSHSLFSNEPLYQFYNAVKLESISRDIAEISGQHESYDDGYEKIGGKLVQDNLDKKISVRPSALELIEPNHGPSRTLWCEIQEVINTEILSTLTPTQKKIQEAKFEILTSEASYLKSLNLLRSHFMNNSDFKNSEILASSDRKAIFSHIIPVQECSDRLLCDLENCWQDNIMLLGLSEHIQRHAEKHFYVYITFCESQGKIERTVRRLKENKPAFVQALEVLESDPICCGLSLMSFLMLPMQRITRMRLLIDAVLSKISLDDDEFECWEKTYILINQILSKCNEAAHKSDQLFEMEIISKQIEFPSNIRPLAIQPVGIHKPGSMLRKLEKKGELTHLIWRGDDAKLTFGKKFSKSNVYAFLFTDLFVLTKKKCDDSFLVIDHCPRALLSVTSGDVIPQLPTKEMTTVGKHLIIMTLLENYEGKTIEMILSCPSETERQRWLKVTEPLTSNNPDEKLYEQWDCPQVVAKHEYHPLQPDELNLEIGDVVNVTRKMADGWCEGERLRDGKTGWFPGNYTEEILTPHIRAKHIKQRHMLLTYTAQHLDTKYKK